jgi:hypothetical protein
MGVAMGGPWSGGGIESADAVLMTDSLWFH